MVCPKCGSYNIMVASTRTTKENTLRRRRNCECGNKWTTFELSSDEMKRIRKMYEYIEKIG
ncbi:MAG TPA: hypothetical protein VLS94_08735, partial [Fusibacter sp.]|nr:hypothetical protein [Fusibacter sp.]